MNRIKLNNFKHDYSAGVGRTGTYIALDIETDEGKDKGSVDVFSCVELMRKQRVNMVQTAVSIYLCKKMQEANSLKCIKLHLAS